MVHYQQIRDAWGGVQHTPGKIAWNPRLPVR